jgi:hypothetical protein
MPTTYDTIQEEGTNLTQRTTLNFIGAALTATDDSVNARTNVTLAITATADSGAVAKQASSPGTQQTGNFNVSGTGIAGILKAANAGSAAAPSLRVLGDTKGLYSGSTNDVGLSANGLEVARFGPDLGIARQARFVGPMVVGNDDAGASYDLAQQTVSLETLRVTPKVGAAGQNTIYAGLNVVNDTGTGNDIVHNGFFHGIQANVGVNSPNAANESSAGEFFMYQYGLGSTFGAEANAYVMPAAAGFSPNVVGLGVGIHNNKKSGTNDSQARGILLAQGSTGAPPSGGGIARGLSVERDQNSDYGTNIKIPDGGTVTATNGSTTVTGLNSHWTQVGDSPFVNLVGKKIRFTADPAGIYYQIASVASDTSLTLTTTYTGTTGSGKSYRIRVVEPWTTDVILRDCGVEGIQLRQDSNFPPPTLNKAFRLRNQGDTDDLWAVNFLGGQEYRGSTSSSPIFLSRPQSGSGFAYSEWTPFSTAASGALFVNRLTTGSESANYEQLIVATDVLASSSFNIYTRKGGTGTARPLSLGTDNARRVEIGTTGIVDFYGNTGAIGAKHDAECSLLTSESNRVAPWIEPAVAATAGTSVTAVTPPTDINGATVTFTPKSNCRIQVSAVFDCLQTIIGATFIGELVVNGSAQSGSVQFEGKSANDRACVAGVWNLTLTGGTSYTIKLTGKLTTTSGNPPPQVDVAATHTKFSIIGVGRF